MAASTLANAKLSLRLTDDFHDSEILRLLNVGAKELGFADVEVDTIESSTAISDPMIEDALIQFVQYRFWGNNADAKKAFDENRAELQTGRYSRGGS